MKIILFSRPSAGASVERFSTLIESIKTHSIAFAVNNYAAEWYAAKGGRGIEPKNCYDTMDEVLTPDSVIISYGGDGTLLSAVRMLGGKSNPILGINSGRLGFLATVSQEDAVRALDELVEGAFTTEKRALLQIEGDIEDEVSFHLAFNEFSVQRRHMGMIGTKVEIDGRVVANYWSDGVIVASPTGSTAYSLSAGGPILAPECHCMVLTPIAPHNLTMRPLVVPDSCSIRLTIDTRDPQAVAAIDNENFTIRNNSSFTITRAKEEVFLVKLQNISFYDTLKNKMMWGLDGRESKF
ncbi:MAG: NAD(+)/NADH kinase [Tidjanibacter sp.]|nr:NAD(+)/NADH kinase [Tidjanibacter sp.]